LRRLDASAGWRKPDVVCILAAEQQEGPQGGPERNPQGEIGGSMANRRLKKIPVGTSSESSHIHPRKRYRVRIDSTWYEGNFSKQWFGWRFDGCGEPGVQLNMVDQVFEIQEAPPKKVRKPKAPSP
jgi:hypothetical protein